MICECKHPKFVLHYTPHSGWNYCTSCWRWKVPYAFDYVGYYPHPNMEQVENGGF